MRRDCVILVFKGNPWSGVRPLQSSYACRVSRSTCLLRVKPDVDEHGGDFLRGRSAVSARDAESWCHNVAATNEYADPGALASHCFERNGGRSSSWSRSTNSSLVRTPDLSTSILSKEDLWRDWR